MGYLMILLVSVAVPALLAAIGFVNMDLRRAFISILLTAIPFLFWDVLATERGDWGFSKEHLIGVYFVGLPLEEILFFFAIPFCCIFLYECTGLLIQEKPIQLQRWVLLVPFAAAAMLIMLNLGRAYTVLACLAFIAAVIALAYVAPRVLAMRRFWLYIGLSFIGFLIVNTALTAPPIVYYSDAAILGNRVGTIPIEDFLYNFALLAFLIIIYLEAPGKAATRPR